MKPSFIAILLKDRHKHVHRLSDEHLLNRGKRARGPPLCIVVDKKELEALY